MSNIVKSCKIKFSLLAGRCNSLASTLDILPTITALTGASTNGLTLDGFDISDLLLEDDAPVRIINKMVYILT